MRFGCCGSIADIDGIAAAGYDFVELPVAEVIPEREDSEWVPVRRTIAKAQVKPEAWNCLIPGTMKITGPESDFKRLECYLETALHRIAEVGGRVVVFGSGAARTVPQGYPVQEAKEQIHRFIGAAGEIAQRNALRLAIEPLNHRESNVLNSVADAKSYAAAINHPSVGVLADLYHIDEEGEPFSNIVDAKHFLMHVHVADTNRLYPGSGSYDYGGFVAALADAGYDKRISCECGWGDDPDSARRSALEFLKKQF